MNLPQYITINGTSYTSAKLSDAAKQQAVNIQAVDAELARLQQQMAFAQTARNAYSAALIDAVKGKAGAVAAEAKEEKPKKPRAPRKPKAKAE
ncbi:MAG: hypothetical protein K0R43_1110 [Pseudoduganella sp.]|nr:hypothetical protein [Pseudoduganella sp.]